MQSEVALSWIEAFSSVVLAISTIVLVIVTWLYYRQSKLQTREMEKTRELRHEPHMKAGLKPSGPNFEIGFVNIGGGIAHNVEAEYWIEGLEQHKREWGTAVHFPNDIYKIGIPLDDSAVGVVGMSEEIEPKLDNGEDTFIVNWTFEDSRGEKFEETQRFQILEEIKKRSESTESYTGGEREVQF